MTNVLQARDCPGLILDIDSPLKSFTMSANSIIKATGSMPALFEDFFKPWNDWFSSPWKGMLNVPAVNIEENEKEYRVSLAVPGMKKDDFKIDVDGNLITVSTEKEETKEEQDKQFARREYNYSSFSRCFTLPEEVDRNQIVARYENGLLTLSLPRKEEMKKVSAKSIAVQ